MTDSKHVYIRVEYEREGYYYIRLYKKWQRQTLSKVRIGDRTGLYHKALREEVNQAAYVFGKERECPVIPLHACKDCRDSNPPYYMVSYIVWGQAHRGDPIKRGFLCWGCLDKRLPYSLEWKHFTDAPVNKELETTFLLWRSNA